MFTEFDKLLHMVSNAGLMVQLVLLTLLLFSLASWSIIVMKYLYIRKAFRESAQFTDLFWKSKSLSDANAQANKFSSSPISRIYRIGYGELTKLSRTGFSKESDEPEPPGMNGRLMGLDNVKRALRRAITTETTRVSQMVPFLATSGNTTPFIGLFGTVWGIMNSFHGIGQRGSASLAVVAPGISEALVATAAGLAVAIPSVIAYNFFMQKIRTMESELQSFASDFLNIIERELLRGKGRGQ
jgi:biopolymer transport protein TolQ